MKPTPKRLRHTYKAIGKEELYGARFDKMFDEITEAIEDLWDD